MMAPKDHKDNCMTTLLFKTNREHKKIIVFYQWSIYNILFLEASMHVPNKNIEHFISIDGDTFTLSYQTLNLTIEFLLFLKIVSYSNKTTPADTIIKLIILQMTIVNPRRSSAFLTAFLIG